MRLAGRWAFWNQYAPQTSIEKCIQRTKDARLEGVIVKYGYPQIERSLTAVGIPWATERYVYPSQPRAEATMLANAVDAGAVAAVINAEVEWEGMGYQGAATAGLAMLELVTAFRARHPTVELYASVDTRGNRLSLPYQQVLRRNIAGWLPMVYPKAFRPTCPAGFVGAAFRDCLDNRDFGGVPMLPTIQTYDGIGAQAIADQVGECKRRGLPGYQAYTIAHATDAEWAAFDQDVPMPPQPDPELYVRRVRMGIIEAEAQGRDQDAANALKLYLGVTAK